MDKTHKTKFGRVVSNKMDKTVVVSVETLRHHPLYKKTIKRAVKFKAHDANKECGLGDMVKIVETRPLSKEKRWRVAEIITKGVLVEVQPKAETVEVQAEEETVEVQPDGDN
jgi:small subunit ribosomal protein S17